MFGRAASPANALASMRGRATLRPSDELREWFDHQPERFAGFRARYRDELATHGDRLAELRERAASRRVTILYAASDEDHNNGVVLAEFLREGVRS